jgi:hypothetical protein
MYTAILTAHIGQVVPADPNNTDKSWCAQRNQGQSLYYYSLMANSITADTNYTCYRSPLYITDAISPAFAFDEDGVFRTGFT